MWQLIQLITYIKLPKNMFSLNNPSTKLSFFNPLSLQRRQRKTKKQEAFDNTPNMKEYFILFLVVLVTELYFGSTSLLIFRERQNRRKLQYVINMLQVSFVSKQNKAFVIACKGKERHIRKQDNKHLSSIGGMENQERF